jgi:hypothetical protein
MKVRARGRSLSVLVSVGSVGHCGELEATCLGLTVGGCAGVQGEVLRNVWRGRMGLSEEEQLKYSRQHSCGECQCNLTAL